MERLTALPLAKSVEIAFKSIKARFFRSLITTMSLVLAVAFLCYVQATNDLANGLLHSGHPEAMRILLHAGYDVQAASTSITESAKQQWIVILSLLVCVVGIVNAQLMAVSERFREIGTMKCLGALDSVVMRLFLIEAGLQGLAGAAAGAVLGIVVALFGALITLGTPVFFSLPLGALTLTALKATGIGCLLSLIGVIYPAITAARMEPVEAMRVEQ
ncbi:MAG TPA: FtsX-like permease family protein [Desulfobulbus sp.]|nr:FtsX-like permease family protein [Desulfobulbus sp.]